METIGVTSLDPWFVLDDDPLIRDLIYFDKLVYCSANRPSLEKFCYSLPNGKEKFDGRMKEIDSLAKAGLIIEYTNEQLNSDKKTLQDNESIKYAIEAGELAKAFLEKDKPFKEKFVDFLETFRRVEQLISRVNSIILNKRELNDFVPIIRSNYFNFAPDKFRSSYTVLSVVLKKIPIISNNIQLEAFIEFKNDPDTKLKLSRLRNWVLEISKKDYSAKEIEQKIEYLLQEYSKQIEIHKLKYDYGNVQAFIMTSLEVLENAAKLKLSKAAKVLFDIGKRDISLLEAEQKFTGKELALIHKLNNQNQF